MSDFFLSEYSLLNPEQKLAVDSIEGPVLLLAGPGSGKTQVLGLRIVNIIRQTGVQPNSILALTFTENAAKNMTRRLTKFLGRSAYKVKVATFHGFANDLITQYPELFLFARDLKPIDEITRTTILESILNSTTLKEIKPFNSPLFYLNNIRSNISNLKKEGIRAKDFNDVLSSHREFLEHNKEVNKYTGKLKGEWQSYEKNINKNAEFAEVYKQYEAELTNLGYYDYEDMINLVHDQLDSNPDFLADIQEHYLYTLVDEYQDTNGAQNRLLLKLNSYDSSPNLFVVGDEDQSIYSFQGANLRNILDFRQVYPDAKVISTKFNYRSRQQVLNVAQDLITHNPDRIQNYFSDVDKQLISAPSLKSKLIPSDPGLEVIEFPTDEDESVWIAKKIKQLLSEGIDSNEIAVIYRNHADALPIMKELTLLDVRYTSDSGEALLEQPLVRKLIRCLEFLNTPTDKSVLLEILHYPFWSIPEVDLYQLIKKYSQTGIDPLELMSLNEEEYSDFPKIKRVYEVLWKLIKLAKLNTPLEGLLINVLEEFGIIAELVTNNDPKQIVTIKTLIQFVQSRQKVKIDYFLDDFIADLSVIKNHSLPFSIRETYKGTSGVRLLTAHASKGLEFSYVFIAKGIDGSWGNRKVPNKLKLLPLTVELEKKSADQQNEERRLFYVGITRAKEKVYLTFANEYKSVTEDKPRLTNVTPFLEEIDRGRYEQAKDEGTNLMEKFLAEVQIKPKSFELESYLKYLVSEFKLSYTAYKDYLECPKRFLYLHLLNLPSEFDVNLLLGSTIHHALEQYGKLRLSGTEGKLVTLNRLMLSISHFLEGKPISKDDFQKIYTKAEEVITKYFPQLQRLPEDILHVERRFSAYTTNLTVPLKGKVDLIAKSGGENIILDYKVSEPKSEAKTKETYYTQLLFYKLLAESDPELKVHIDSVGIEFIKPTKAGNYKRITFRPSESEIAELSANVRLVYDKIINLEFDGFCGKLDKCSICQMKQLKL